jgi:type I restriction enzyme, S subunit
MSFPRYPAYKPSGVEWLGEVPEHWEVLPLRRLIRQVSSGTSVNAIDEPASPGQAGVLKTSCVYTGKFRPEENKAILESELDRATCTVVAGSLVVSRMNTPELVGAAGIVKNDDPFLFLPDRLWLVSFQDCDPQFMNYWCKSVSYRSQVQLACSGTSSSMQNLSQDNFYSFIAPLSPTGEQSTIATFLDHETAKIDALIAEQQRLIELLQEKRQAVISHAVTKGLNPDAPMKDSGVEWLGEVPEHWEIKQLKFLLEDLSQGCSPNCLQDPAENGQYGVLKVGCVNEIEFRSGENKALPDTETPSLESLIREGDILMSRGNTPELVGLSAVVPEETRNLLASDLIFVLRVNRESVLPHFLSLLIRSLCGRHQIESQCVGTSSSMQKINQGTIKSLLFALPPMEEQQLIASVVHRQITCNAQLSMDASNAIALLQERRSALISAAVTGQIDVRGLVPEAVAA